MAAPRAAGAGRRWLREAEAQLRGAQRGGGGSGSRWEGDYLPDYPVFSSLTDLPIAGLDSDPGPGGILGSISGCIDQSIISIIEDTSQTENKSHLDEESEATLLTALTEILDTFDDENASPFDSIPDSEIFALPKGGEGSSLVECHSYAMPADSGKEPTGHLVSAAVRGPSALLRSEKLATRTEEISKQRSDGDEEEEDVLSNSQNVSESGSEMLGLQSAEPLDPAGLESNVAFVIGPNVPCGYDVEHVSLSDLVKYIQPYCDASEVLCLGTDTDSAGSVIEVQVIQEDDLQDLQLRTVLGDNGEYRMEAIGVNGKGLVAGEESVMTKVPDPENLPQVSKPEEALLGPLVHQEDPPVTLRRRGRPRKTAKRTEVLDSGAQHDISEIPGAQCGLRTRLQRAADKRRASSDAPSPQAGGKQEPAALTLQESTLLARQMEEVELGEKRIQTRGRAAARKQRAAGQGPKKLPSPEIQATGRDWSFAKAEGWSTEPYLGSAAIPAKPATGREESPGNILATTFPMADPATTSRAASPAPTSRAANPAPTFPMADPAPTSRAANPTPTSQAANPAPTSWAADPAPTSWAASPAPTSRAASPAPTSQAANPAPTFPMADPAPTSWAADPAPTSRAASPAPTSRAASPAPTSRAASPAPTLRAADPAPTPPFPVCAAPSPVAIETTNNEPKLRPISLQQYRLRLQQRKPDQVPSAPAKPRNAWPIVPIQSIVHGELSVLPLEPTGHMLNPQSQGYHGQPLAPPTQTPPSPVLPQPIQTLASPQIPATPSQWPDPPTPILAPSPCVTQAQLCPIQPSTKQEVAICAMLQEELACPAETRVLSGQSQPVHTSFVQPTATPSPPLIQGDSECPIRIPAATGGRAAAAAQLDEVGMCSAVKEEQIPNQQTDLLQAEADQTPTVQTLPVKCASEQLLQLPRATVAQDEIDAGPLSSVEERSAEDILKGIEAADLMSLLEKFEVTAVNEKLPPGNSNGSEEDKKLFDYIFGTELASTAGLTPPATPPQQIWTSVTAVGFLGKRRLQGAAEPLSGSPIRTVKLIEPKPLPQSNRTKCLSNESLPPAPETPLTASLGFGDHAYCLPRVSSQPSSHICQPVMAHPDVACRWNVKRQASITIKPITWWNGQCWSPNHRVLTAEQQQVSDSGSDESVSDSQETLREDRVSSNTLPTGTASVEPGRSCSQAVDRRNVGSDAALKLNGGVRVTLSPCRNGESEGDKPFDSPHHCSRTRTSPHYRRQRYSSSSSSTSRSRSHSPVRKRRRYCRRRSRHSRHSSRSDSRSSSRSRSCSRSHSGSDSGSRTQSSRRHSIQMSYFTDAYDSYSEEPQRRYSRHESHAQKSNRRRELAIEERRVVYVGKIRNGMMCEELRRRFEVFGEIEDCNIYFRNEGDNYGFVTYRYTCDAFAAIENGQTLRQPDELPFDLCFGGRRQFCKSNYADLDSSQANFSSYSTKSKFDSLDFDTLLKQAKRSLRR